METKNVWSDDIGINIEVKALIEPRKIEPINILCKALVTCYFGMFPRCIFLQFLSKLSRAG